MNELVKYLGQRSFLSKVICQTDTSTHTRRTDCSTWPTSGR